MQGLAAGTGSRDWVSVQATASRSPGNTCGAAGRGPRSFLRLLADYVVTRGCALGDKKPLMTARL